MKVNFIITTLNGYIIERIRVTEGNNPDSIIDSLLTQSIHSNRLGDFIYGDDMMGSMDDLEVFITEKSNENCKGEFRDGFKSHTFIEKWMTGVVGYFDDIYVGLELLT